MTASVLACRVALLDEVHKVHPRRQRALRIKRREAKTSRHSSSAVKREGEWRVALHDDLKTSCGERA
jgi:hypothetical protein